MTSNEGLKWADVPGALLVYADSPAVPLGLRPLLRQAADVIERLQRQVVAQREEIDSHLAAKAGMARELERRAPETPVCTRSHPHELMSRECELLTEIARLTNQLANVTARTTGRCGICEMDHDTAECPRSAVKASPAQEPTPPGWQDSDYCEHGFAPWRCTHESCVNHSAGLDAAPGGG